MYTSAVGGEKNKKQRPPAESSVLVTSASQTLLAAETQDWASHHDRVTLHRISKGISKVLRFCVRTAQQQQQQQQKGIFHLSSPLCETIAFIYFSGIAEKLILRKKINL